MSWRGFANWAKERDITLRFAEWLGRGRGRMRFLDHLNPPRQVLRKPDLTRWHTQELAAVWIGHATVLLRVGGMNILTDPVLSNRVGVGLGLATGGPQRLVAPALSIHELPKLDLIIVSHAHFDHLDRPTLARLSKNVPVITSRHNQDLIRDLGFRNVTEMQWGESLQVRDIKLTARQVQHWGARTFYDNHRGFSAFLIESSKHKVFYGGDTAYHELFKDIRKVDLAIFGIGAYDPYIQAHASPEQALQMADHMSAEHVLPMHHSTFRLSYEPDHEPIERILAAAGRNTDRIVAREVGDQWALQN